MEELSDPWTVEKALAAQSIVFPAVAAAGSSSSSRPATSTPIPFFHVLERLKTTKRQGWRRYGIEQGESIADHMHRMAVMALFAPAELRAGLDLAKCVCMALLHDVAEAVVGDLTPADGVPKTEKARREAATMDYFVAHSGDAATAVQMRADWLEFEAGRTPESAFVQDLDKVELLLQMVEYETHHGVDLSEFTYVTTKIRLPAMQRWAAAILDERPAAENLASKAQVPAQPGAAKATVPVPVTVPAPVASSKAQLDEYYGGTE
ncbi:HD domain protein [Niveomyces insectorum RCEF 264]|uniref:5'-deoxynucleotidase n=1 Tax=Niveomyces insectorum RCEF 264 TaxID=1081102 RepID=A0A167TGE6_9HYPO|nr:HD domain protein [Niveomyces insectorum RCEF 264]